MNVAGKENDTNPNDAEVFSPYKWPEENKRCDIHNRWYEIPSHFYSIDMNTTLTLSLDVDWRFQSIEI